MSARYYVVVDEALFRLRTVDHQALIERRAKLCSSPDKTLKLIEAILPSRSTRAAILRGIIYRFDENGYLDIAGATNATAILYSKSTPPPAPNVVDIVPALNDQSWTRTNSWQIDRQIARLIQDDISGRADLSVFKVGTE